MDDLISRQAAIDAIRKHEVEIPVYTPRETDIFWDDAIDCCVNVIEELPSAQPERKTGRWIFPYGDKKYKKCSTCGRTYYSIPHTSNYCPNCGAWMGGGA